MPGAEAQAAFHRSAHYFHHPYFEQRRQDERAFDLRSDLVFREIGRPFLLPHRAGIRLLDVGCDTGGFLLAALRREAVVGQGVDVSPSAVEEARARGLAVHAGTLETAPAGFSDYDVITAFDLIEHVPEPLELLTAIRTRLRPNGICFIQTPNGRSSVFAAGGTAIHLLGPRPWLSRLFPEEHTYCITPQGLRALAARAGFEVLTIDTRPLDGPERGLPTVARAGIAALSGLDRLLGRDILLCAVLRRGEGSP